MYEIVFSRRFQSDLKRILRRDSKLKPKVRKVVELLSSNPVYPSLRLHKLSGIDNWSVSITSSIRMIFRIDGKVIFCSRIGTHDEVY